MINGYSLTQRVYIKVEKTDFAGALFILYLGKQIFFQK